MNVLPLSDELRLVHFKEYCLLDQVKNMEFFLRIEMDVPFGLLDEVAENAYRYAENHFAQIYEAIERISDVMGPMLRSKDPPYYEYLLEDRWIYYLEIYEHFLRVKYMEGMVEKKDERVIMTRRMTEKYKNIELLCYVVENVHLWEWMKNPNALYFG